MPEGEKQLVKLVLDTDAAGLLLKLAGGPRKQGEYVSRLIRAAAASQEALSRVEEADVAELRQMLRGVVLDVAELKVRLAQRS